MCSCLKEHGGRLSEIIHCDMLFRDEVCFQLLPKFVCSLCVGFVLDRNTIFFFFYLKRRSSIKMCEAVGATCDCRDANEITHAQSIRSAASSDDPLCTLHSLCYTALSRAGL